MTLRGYTHETIMKILENEKARQTYYGALNYRTGEVMVKAYPQGNTENNELFKGLLILYIQLS